MTRPKLPELLTIQRLQIQSIGLMKLEVARSDRDPSGEVSLEINFKANGRRDGPTVVALIDMSLAARSAQAAGDTTEFTLASTFRIVYVLAPGPEITDEEAQRVADTNGVFNAWPYFRELLQSTLARCGLPAVLLPLARIGELPIQGAPAPAAQPRRRGGRAPVRAE